jgi:hypothetical protein
MVIIKASTSRESTPFKCMTFWKPSGWDWQITYSYFRQSYTTCNLNLVFIRRGIGNITENWIHA